MKNPLQKAIARARFRKQAPPMRYAFADDVDWLNHEHWDRVTTASGLFLQRDYLRALQTVRPANIEPRYALVYREQEPVAALAMQLVDLDPARLHDEPKKGGGVRGLAARAVAKVADRMTPRVLVVGNVLTYGNHGIALAPGCERDRDVWHGIGEAAYRVRRAEKHGGSADFVLVKDLADDELDHSSVLRDLGFRAVATEPDMVLALAPAWRSHDDFLAAMASKYRKNIRSRVLQPIDGAAIAVRRLDDVGAAKDRLHELYLAVHGRAALRPVTLSADYWPQLANCAGRRAHFSGLVRGDDLLGFIVTLLHTDETAIGYHIGFDRSAAESLPLYLRLLHCSVADAIDLGAKRVSFGRTALEPKAMLGAKPQPLNVWVRHRQPVLNKLLRGLLSRIHHDEAPERNPFGKPSDG